MSKIKSFSVNNGDMFYICHNTDNFTVIDCCLPKDRKEKIMDEICSESKDKYIFRLISTHPDEDHIHGLSYFNERKYISNFYCVANAVVKEEETESFVFYCQCRDGNEAYNIEKDCSRKWFNLSGENEQGKYIGQAGMQILWPDTKNQDFKDALKAANNGENDNNISPIIKYSMNKGLTALWFGDLEHVFMDKIKDNVDLPKADIVFASHHGRKSGSLPEKWLKQIQPKVIIIGEAPSDELDYYSNYNHITQNTTGDITLICEEGIVHFYVSNPTYECPTFLTDKYKKHKVGEYYIGSLTTYEQ